MSEFIEINPGEGENDEDWGAISEYVSSLAESNENISRDANEPVPSHPEETARSSQSQSEPINFSYIVNDMNAEENNFQYIREEVYDLLSELSKIRAARASLQDRLHNLNI